MGGGNLLKMNNLQTQHINTTPHNTRIIYLTIFVALTFCIFSNKVQAQNLALKNNILYDAMLTPNLGLEARVADKWTVGFNVGFNPWPLNDQKFPKWRHILVAPQFRYYFCTVFARDFLEVNAVYSHYNVGGVNFPIGTLYPVVRENRLQGDLVAAGAAYGWTWVVSPHFSLEAEAGFDVGYTWFKKFECPWCGSFLGDDEKWFVMPKFGFNAVWQIF